ncbi:unnamed protein product [Lampetra planeri]
MACCGAAWDARANAMGRVFIQQWMEHGRIMAGGGADCRIARCNPPPKHVAVFLLENAAIATTSDSPNNPKIKPTLIGRH